jgi:hypothetical protein
MFGFFKKKQPATSPWGDIAHDFEIQRQRRGENTPAATNGPSVEQMIHDDVYSAQELLLAEAQRVLDEPFGYSTERTETLEKLSELGFKNSQECAEYEAMKKSRAESKRLKETIEKYRHSYPLNKFIDEKTVERVCKKYDLVLTVASRYVAEIPDKNKQEIINFRAVREDYSKRRYEKERDRGERWQFYITTPVSLEIYMREVLEQRLKEEGITMEQYNKQRVHPEGLLIMAPMHKLNTQGLERDGHRLRPDMKDPIVLFPVEEGYIIVSSWGLEAADGEIINPITN